MEQLLKMYAELLEVANLHYLRLKQNGTENSEIGLEVAATISKATIIYDRYLIVKEKGSVS